MDLSDFNKHLKTLVNRARREEARKNVENAKDAWIEVAEFTIKFYKHTKLEPSFRNMLITKTEGIIQHVKNLDRKLRMSQTLSDLEREQEAESQSHEGEISATEVSDHMQSSEMAESKSAAPHEIDKPQQTSAEGGQAQKIKVSKEEASPPDKETQEQKTTDLPSVPSQVPQEEPEVIEDSEFKNIPQGFKEIKASQDFEVITPYDKEEIEKRLSVNHDMSIFKYDDEEESSKEEASEQPEEQIEKPDKNQAIICFACGEKNSPGAKKCKNCGTELD
jgi:ribosomal protein L40E